MFVDSVTLILESGKGGQGAVSFHREKFILQGGPDGGDGGRGGSVFFYVDNNTDTLSAFRGRKKLKAKNGQPGGTRKCYGKAGEDLTVTVPPGTQVVDAETGELLLDLEEVGQKVLFLAGGKGGLGNVHFKSSTNQRPTHAQKGMPGESRQVKLELKLIADVGLVGFPNVGKSTLISTLSSARPEVADYEFTTLTPKLGVVDAGDYRSFVLADIPGIIGGASDGKGLGLQFLRHIERTGVLLFMLDAANYRTLHNQYKTLREELKKYSEPLSNKPYAIGISRVDAMTPEEAVAKVREFIGDMKMEEPEYREEEREGFPCLARKGYDKHDRPYFLIPFSSVARINLKVLTGSLMTMVDDGKKG